MELPGGDISMLGISKETDSTYGLKLKKELTPVQRSVSSFSTQRIHLIFHLK